MNLWYLEEKIVVKFVALLSIRFICCFICGGDVVFDVF